MISVLAQIAQISIHAFSSLKLKLTKMGGGQQQGWKKLSFIFLHFNFFSSPIRAKGLQSVVQLMGEKDLYEYWSETYKTHTLKWTTNTAKEILASWQAKFSEEVKRKSEVFNKKRLYNVDAFSTSNLESVLQEFSSFSPSRIVVGYALMVIYPCLFI